MNGNKDIYCTVLYCTRLKKKIRKSTGPKPTKHFRKKKNISSSTSYLVLFSHDLPATVGLSSVNRCSLSLEQDNHPSRGKRDPRSCNHLMYKRRREGNDNECVWGKKTKIKREYKTGNS